MSATVTPPRETTSVPEAPSVRPVPPRVERRLLTGLGGFAALAAFAVGILIFTGATLAFNILVFTIYTALWIGFVWTLATKPAMLNDVWTVLRERSLLVQGIAWLLFLPLLIALWIWRTAWSLPVRLVLVLGIGAWNIFMFLPRPQ